MANSISRGYTFASTELVTNAKLHALVDSATQTIDTVGNTLYVGPSTTEGSWKIAVVGTAFNFYRYESSSWVLKGGYTA